jgi:hypothetical protein
LEFCLAHLDGERGDAAFGVYERRKSIVIDALAMLQPSAIAGDPNFCGDNGREGTRGAADGKGHVTRAEGDCANELFVVVHSWFSESKILFLNQVERIVGHDKAHIPGFRSGKIGVHPNFEMRSVVSRGAGDTVGVESLDGRTDGKERIEAKAGIKGAGGVSPRAINST